jgi:hypothetical protein
MMVNIWARFAFESVLLAIEAQRVIFLRMLVTAAGGSRAQTEAQRMIAEKFFALIKSGSMWPMGRSPISLVRHYRSSVATLIRPAAALIAKLRMPYPGWRLVGSIWLTIFLSIALTLLSGDTTKPLIAETRELIYAVSILAFVILWLSAMQARKVAIPELRVKSI